MKDLIIVGAGGMGRKLFTCVQRINKIENKWNIKGYIDDNLHALDGIKTELSLIGTIKNWNPSENEVFVMGISDSKIKYKVAKQMKEKGAKFETIVSPEVLMGEYVEIGEGSVVITPYNVESCAKIGKFVTLLGSTIALDGEIGDYSTTAGFANLTTAKIGKGAYVASHVVIVPGINIGDGAYVGAGSIVTRDIKPFTKVFGNPARVIGEEEEFDYE